MNILIAGLHTVYEPLEDIVPIPPEDYRIRHLVSRSRPPHFVDMDMLYANRKLPNIYCFDSQGSWINEVNILFFKNNLFRESIILY